MTKNRKPVPSVRIDRTQVLSMAAEVISAALNNHPGSAEAIAHFPLSCWPDDETRKIAGAIARLHATRKAVDMVSVFDELNAAGDPLDATLIDGIASRAVCSYVGDVSLRLDAIRDFSFRDEIAQRARQIADSIFEIPKAELRTTLADFVGATDWKGAENSPSLLDRKIEISLEWITIELPRRQFALGHTAPLGRVTVLCAAGGVGKSYLSLQAMMSVACGKTLIPGWTPYSSGKVLYLSLEDEAPEVERRMQRIAKAFDLNAADADLVRRNLIVVPMSRVDFFRPGQGKSIEAGPDLDALAALMRAEPIALCVVDPIASLLAGFLEEDANEVAQRVIGMFASILPESTALLLTGHTAKADRDFATSARGAGAWTDAARQAWGLRMASEKEGKDLPPEIDRHDAVILHSIKSNFTAHLAPVVFRRLNGPDVGGVLVPFDLNTYQAVRIASDVKTLEDALFAVLAEHDCTRAELCGNTCRNYANGKRVRDLVIDMVNRKVSQEQFKSLAARLLSEGRLTQQRGEGGRMRLLPSTVEAEAS